MAELMDIRLCEMLMSDYDAYYLHKCEDNDIYWNGFEGKPDEEGLKKAFVSRIGIPDKDRTGKVIRKIEVNGVYAGYIQYTPSIEETEIGIGVVSSYAGKGIGGKAVSLALDEVRTVYKNKPFARVRDDNEASIKCFTRQGFKATDIVEREIFYPLKDEVNLRKYIPEE